MPISIQSVESNASILAPQIHNTRLSHTPTTGSFNLPSKLKQVVRQVHRSEPEVLPDYDANVHEVRYFLFQLLTVEAYKIARLWPQWVLETCANWNGTGADLRALSSKELRNLCPLDSGHCKIDQHEKISQYPPPDCRKHIGEVISAEVMKMKAKEDQKAKLEREWKETQLGGSGRHRILNGLNRNPETYEQPLTQPDYHQPTHIRRAMSTISAPLFPLRTRQDHYQRAAHDAISSGPFARATSVAPMHTLQTTIAGSRNLSHLPSPTTSGGDSWSSGSMSNTTALTSPRGSTELPFIQANHPSSTVSSICTRSLIAPQPVHQLRPVSSAHIIGRCAEQQPETSPGIECLGQNRYPYLQLSNIPGTPHPAFQKSPTAQMNQTVSLQQTFFPNFNFRTAPPNIVNLATPYVQRTKFNDPQNIHRYPKLLANGALSANNAPQSQHEQPFSGKIPSSPECGAGRSVSPTPDDSISMTGAFREMQLEDRVSFMHPEVPFQASSRTLRAVPGQHSDPTPLRNTVHPNSIYYPRPDISGPRHHCSRRTTSPTPSIVSSIASSTARSIAPSLLHQFPINRKKNIPVVKSTQGPHRSAATSQADQFAFSQAEYVSFKRRKGQVRTEVIEAEVERMHGMVPSHLHGAGLEHVGPSVRVMNPATGQPFPTLVEQIREREILDGRSQRGASGSGGLDCEYMRNHQYFFRGT
jgi:hypothetical protein